jgi:hypothetical protein
MRGRQEPGSDSRLLVVRGASLEVRVEIPRPTAASMELEREGAVLEEDPLSAPEIACLHLLERPSGVGEELRVRSSLGARCREPGELPQVLSVHLSELGSVWSGPGQCRLSLIAESDEFLAE